MSVGSLSPGFKKFMSRKPNSHDFNASQQTIFLFDAIPKRLSSAICVTCRISMRFIPLHHNTSTWRSTRPNANRDELKSEKFNTYHLEATEYTIPKRYKC